MSVMIDMLYENTVEHPVFENGMKAVQVTTQAAIKRETREKLVRIIVAHVHADGQVVPVYRRVMPFDDQGWGTLMKDPVAELRACGPDDEPTLIRPTGEPTLEWMSSPSCWVTWAIRAEVGPCFDALATKRTPRRRCDG